MSPLVSTTQPAVASPALPLPPRGIEDAADAEMDGVSGGVADVLGASGTPRLLSSVSGSAPPSADPAASPALGPHTAESAALDQRRQKAKAKKQRQKAKKKVEARQRTDEAKSERQDGAATSRQKQRHLSRASEERHHQLIAMQELLEDMWGCEFEDGEDRRQAWYGEEEEEEYPY